MAVFSTSDFKPGLKVIYEGEPCAIVENEFVKPGKGQAFNRTRLKKLISGKVLQVVFKSGETVEAADVFDVNLTYLYNDGEVYYFMNEETFEQIGASQEVVGDAIKWLKDQAVCIITLWNGSPIAVQPPNFVELKVVDTDPGLKGDTAGTGGKPATLETGAVVRVPLFIQIDEVIRVDTRSAEYIGRVK
ncbi:elongation factor P [Psittacicella hinzii]|uniref:Elongation factor P n=1 Tax=Psittacicella hinzii TaxID=2028575 RepID=A0A3A1YCK7_9GAMM|nr:elongation factor P [Psittacicella hinzii]RIY34900.1 elongation factor P [Psittacicella hinzii]